MPRVSAARPAGARGAVWIHAVSVGEVLSVRPVLALLKKRHPDWWVLLSTTQRHARELARAQCGAVDVVCWLPWDLARCIRTAVGRVRPDLLVLVECELWPNLIVRSARLGVPVAMMNARIYERDLPGYRLGRWLFGPVLRLMSFIGAQSEADRDRFLSLGASAERLRLAGNTKFDVEAPADGDSRLAQLRALLPLSAGPLWVLASTHDDEESQILSRCGPLIERFPGLQLLIAPRHTSRAPVVKRLADRLGFRTALRSELPQADTPGSHDELPRVIILDTMGELPIALGLADLVFVGGSLVDKGGHNPIEAGLHGKPILVGPSGYNFAAVLAAFHAEQALTVARTADELISQVAELLADASRRGEMSRRAAAVVRRHQGVAQGYVAEFERLGGLR